MTERYYTTSTAFLEALAEAGVTYVFANLGGDHPGLIEAMAQARRSIHILGWAFDPDTPFAPTLPGEGEPERWGPFLRGLADERPELDIRLLIWKSALPIAATQNLRSVGTITAIGKSGWVSRAKRKIARSTRSTSVRSTDAWEKSLPSRTDERRALTVR